MSVRAGLPGEKNTERIMKFSSKWAKIEIFGAKNQLSL